MAVRLDKWLWAARFYKTRGAATEAVLGGKVTVNGDAAKPARQVSAGDTIRIRIAPHEWTVVVTALAERRGSAAQAALLFEESVESRTARELRIQQLKDAPLLRFEGGKPNKQDRRTIRKLREKD